MKKSTRSLLKKLEKSEDKRLLLVRKYLDKYGIRVGQWLPYDAKGPATVFTYHACFETHRVFIPVPVDDYSLYVCMHEIGHLVSGERSYAYLQEWDAEQWALAKGRKYGYYRKAYEAGAKRYVRDSLYEDIAFRQLQPTDVSVPVMRWIGMSADSIRAGAIRWVNNWMKGDVELQSFHEKSDDLELCYVDNMETLLLS